MNESKNEKYNEIIDISLSRYSALEDDNIFMSYVDAISKKLNIDENILKFYVINEGNIENIIDGIKLEAVTAYNMDYEFSISDNIKLKDNIIKTDLLYNFATFCVSRGFNTSSYFLGKYKTVENSNKNIFDNEIQIDIQEIFSGDPDNVSIDWEAHLLIEIDKVKDLYPENCSIDLLEENYDLEEYIDDELYNVGGFVPILIEIELTESLDSNFQLIDDYIEKHCDLYKKGLPEIKSGCRKFFESQLLENGE